MIHGFIADFFCNDLSLVVEIDGGIHEQQKDYDQLHTKIINQYGIKVIRFSNEEVIDKSDRVLEKLKEAIKGRQRKMEGGVKFGLVISGKQSVIRP